MDSVIHIQGNPRSDLTPLILIHAVSGFALPYLALGSLGSPYDVGTSYFPFGDFDTSSICDDNDTRPVYGISSPAYSQKGYRLPGSLEDLAQEYVALIQREIQPKGPYLLGGWSMGGMIALKMASVLRQRGETVLHVIMIDSTDPRTFQPFADPAEHESLTILTFKGVARRMRMRSVTALSNSTCDSDSDDDQDGPIEMLSRLRSHIHNGIRIIAGAKDKGYLSEGYDGDATLIKCTSLGPMSPVLSRRRRSVARRRFDDEHLGWTKNGGLPNLRTVMFSSDHDSAFDGANAVELTEIIQDILSSIV
ncbi:MAG: hypothetical protein M1815_001267 [Lichina confinis]|nr:MAG: hypothetical protein M1815_001267 [Lichina confinis]